MKEIYVVTAGSYSDYRILEVFESADKAASYIDARRKRVWDYDEPRIEVYKVYDDRIKSVKSKAVYIYRYRVNNAGQFLKKYIDLEITSQKKANKKMRSADALFVYCILPEPDIKKACKILADKFYERKAQFAGITDFTDAYCLKNGRKPAKCPNGGIVF